VFTILLPALAACGEPVEEEPLPTDEDIAAWNEAYRDHLAGKADSSKCSGIVVPDQSGFKKHLALTFDDGPSLTNTPQVLKILAAHGAKATFFVNGKNVSSEARRALLKDMVAAGHLIGNHSQNHLQLTKVSEATLRSEVEQTRQVQLAAGATPRYFRFPFGAATCAAKSTVESYGYAVVGWHIDSADWCFASGGGYCPKKTFQYVDDKYRGDLVGYVLSQAKQTGGGVLLFHDIHGYTVSVLDELLDGLEQAGYSFVLPSDQATFPLLNGNTAAKPWIGDPCASDAGCGFLVNSASSKCLTYALASGGAGGFCSAPCEGTCPDRAGKATTFCATVSGKGACVSRASSVNQQCQTIPGTAPTLSTRFLGKSSAAPATVLVCLPKGSQAR